MVTPISNNILLSSGGLLFILQARIQELNNQKNKSLARLNQFKSLSDTLAKLKQETQDIEKNSSLSSSFIHNVILSDSQAVVKFFTNKIRLTAQNNYKTGDESQLSYNGTNYFVRKLSDKDIALYQTKDQAVSGGSAGLISFSGNENSSIVKITRQDIVSVTHNYTETDAFKNLLKIARNSVGGLTSPLITKDFIGFESKLTTAASNIQNNELQPLGVQIKNLETRISSLQNLINLLSKTQTNTKRQIGFLGKLGGQPGIIPNLSVPLFQSSKSSFNVTFKSNSRSS